MCFVCAKSLQSCPTLCNPIDCSPPGSSVHGILQARILEWVATAPSPGNLPAQGSNLYFSCLLPWQADSLPLSPPGSPCRTYFPVSSYILNSMLDIINFTFLRAKFYCFNIVRICLAYKLFGNKMNPFKLGVYLALRQLQITQR